jgi:hypothetical protein
LTSTYNYYALDFIKKLKNTTMVKRALQQKSWKTDAYGGGGGGGESIFDDFFGGSSAKKQTQDKKVEEK